MQRQHRRNNSDTHSSPIYLSPFHQVNGEVCNTVRALWTEDKKDISDDQYKEFYR